MRIVDMTVPRQRPVQFPEAQYVLEDLLEDVPEPELSSLNAFMQTCWTQRLSGPGGACRVNAVSDYAAMPSVTVKSRVIKAMMSKLDALPQGCVQDILRFAEGQWKTDVTVGLAQACRQFFPRQRFLHHTTGRVTVQHLT